MRQAEKDRLENSKQWRELLDQTKQSQQEERERMKKQQQEGEKQGIEEKDEKRLDALRIEVMRAAVGTAIAGCLKQVDMTPEKAGDMAGRVANAAWSQIQVQQFGIEESGWEGDDAPQTDVMKARKKSKVDTLVERLRRGKDEE